MDTVYKLGTDVHRRVALETKSNEILRYFETLYAAWGPQNWWPASSPFEVIVGTILAQNTAWTNVEKAMKNLRVANVLSVRGIRNIPTDDLERMLRPSGYFRQKAKRLKDFADWLDSRFGGSLSAMFATSTAELRQELLGLNGIGPETADSILLYGGQHEVFVVDAYTRRIFERHRLTRTGTSHEEIRIAVEGALTDIPAVPKPSVNASISASPVSGFVNKLVTIVIHPPSTMSAASRSEAAQHFNDFHALIVQAGKHFCQSRIAKCDACPLRLFLKGRKPLVRKRPRSDT